MKLPKSPLLSQGSTLVTLATLTFAIAALYFAKSIFLPIALAVLICFILTPVVQRLERLKLGRIASVVVVVVLAFSTMGALGWVATSQIVELSNQLPSYKNNLIQKIRSVRGSTTGKLEKATEALQDIQNELTTEESQEEDNDSSAEASGVSPELKKSWLRSLEQLVADESAEDDAVKVKVIELPPSPLSQITAWLGPLMGPFSTAGIVIVLVIFMLIRREDLRDRVIQLCGIANIHATTEAIDDGTSRLSRYLRMQLLVNTIYGVVVAAGLFFIGIPNAILWGVFGTLLRFLPYVGPWISALMPITLSLAVSEGWGQPMSTVGLFVVLELVVNNVLEPWLYGASTGVTSLGVILAAIFWTWLWGPVGLVLAVPLTVCLLVVGQYVPQLAFLTVLLGDQSGLEPHERLYQRLLTADDMEASRLLSSLAHETTLTNVYDELMVPALHLAERDRHAGRLSEPQELEVNDSARELIEELGELPSDEETAGHDKLPQCRLFALPVQDQADETGAMMVGQLLRRKGFDTDVASLDLLVGEVLDRIEQNTYAAVVLTVIPPFGSKKGRYLCKRLRQRFSDLYILVATLDGDPSSRTSKRFLDCGANAIVSTIHDVIDQMGRVTRYRKPHEVQKEGSADIEPLSDEELRPA